MSPAVYPSDTNTVLIRPILYFHYLHISWPAGRIMVLIAYTQNPWSISKTFTARMQRGALVRPSPQYSVYKNCRSISLQRPVKLLSQRFPSIRWKLLQAVELGKRVLIILSLPSHKSRLNVAFKWLQTGCLALALLVTLRLEQQALLLSVAHQRSRIL